MPNKTGAYHINAIEYPCNFFWVVKKNLQQFTFCHYIDSFSPWEDIVRKKVSKLRSIAELRAFDGTTLYNMLISWILKYTLSFC
jgi:hypothetical protein